MKDDRTKFKGDGTPKTAKPGHRWGQPWYPASVRLYREGRLEKMKEKFAETFTIRTTDQGHKDCFDGWVNGWGEKPMIEKQRSSQVAAEEVAAELERRLGRPVSAPRLLCAGYYEVKA